MLGTYPQKSVDNLRGLWTSREVSSLICMTYAYFRIFPVDKPGLWIIHDLSTTLPQENAIYPQFCTQPRRRLFGLPKGVLGFIPIIHSPYYYYYSKNIMV